MQSWLKEFYPQHLTLCLGIFGLANLWAFLWGAPVKIVALIALLATAVLSVGRLLVFPKIRQQEWDAIPPLGAYVVGICAGYFGAQVVGTYSLMAGKVIWLMLLLIHLVLLVRFTQLQLKNGWQWSSIHPMWFLFYVGLGVAAIPGPAIDMGMLSKVLAVVSLVSYVGLVPFVVVRSYIKLPLPAPMVPTKMLLEAAPSMTLTALLSSFDKVPMPLALTLLLLGQGFFFILLLETRTFLKLPFTPAHSAFTFPLAIGAMAIYQFAMHYLPVGSIGATICWVLFVAEFALATVIILFIVLYTLWQDVKKYMKAH